MGVTRQPGRCCIGCVGRWSGRGVSAWQAWWRSDETYVGGRDAGLATARRRRRRHKHKAPLLESKKSIVVIAVEVLEPPKGFGRIRLRRVRTATEENVLPFVWNPSNRVQRFTPTARGFTSLCQNTASSATKRCFSAPKIPQMFLLPGVHRVASLLKRWLLGTHQGSVQPHQLDYYLDEFTFRFNRRSSRSRGLLFYRLLEQAVATSPVTYRAIAKSV